MQSKDEEVAPEEDTPIAEFFARDPFSHTEQSLDAIIKKLRSQRERFKAGNKSAGSPKPPTKAEKARQAAMKIGGDDLLGSLDL
jgi:hypothetical protein